jgi:hypothetical protein
LKKIIRFLTITILVAGILITASPVLAETDYASASHSTLYYIDGTLNQVSSFKILGKLDTLKLSELTPYREVVLCVAYVKQNTTSQIVHFIWKDTRGYPMFIYGYLIPSGNSLRYCYSYQAYVPWEIWAIGTYSVDIKIGGKLQETKYVEVK